MQKFKKHIIFLLTIVMSLMFVTTVWAANTDGVTYEIVLNKSTICATGTTQTIEFSIKTNKKVLIDSLDAKVIVPNSFVITGIRNEDLGFVTTKTTETDQLHINLGLGNIIWLSPAADNKETDLLATVRLQVPANSGSYKIRFQINTISSNYGDVWEDGTTIETTLNVVAHDMQETTAAVAPGCETTGSTAVYTCANGCGKTEGGTEVPATGHTWTDATCTAPKTCSVCGATEGEALGHSDILNDGDHICDICEEVFVGEHTYGAASCETPATCSECGATTGEPLGHDYVVSYTNNGDTHTMNSVCKNDESHSHSASGLNHTYDQPGDKCVCGAEKPVTGLKGDVNLDDKVDALDLDIMVRYVPGLTTISDPQALINADVNEDGKIDAIDLDKFVRFVPGLITDWNAD